MTEYFPGTQLVAKFDFDAQDPGEISVREREVLEVLEVKDDWVLARRTDDTQGFVPLSYVEPYEPFGEGAVGGSPSQEVPEEAGYSRITVGCVVVAIDDFSAEAEQELSVSENERLKVISMDGGGWCTVESIDRGAAPGLVPLSYLRFSESQDVANFTVRTSSRRLATVEKDPKTGKEVIQYTFLITEPAGPPKRMFYDEILEPLERQRVMTTFSDKAKAYQQAAYEIYMTEIDYVRDMQILVDVFYQPMVLEKSIPSDVVQGIFTEHIPSLLGVHEILLRNIKQIREKGVTKAGVARVFEKLASAFQNYGYYFVNHAGALKLLNRKKEGRSFANFIKICEANPLCRNLNLQSYLIKPIQRLTKYPLLLKELLDNCEDSEEAREITSVLSKIVRIVTQLNEDQRLTENREQILEIIGKFGDKSDKRELLEKLTPKPDFLNKDSTYVRTAKAGLLTNGKHSADVHLFLFHDFLVCGKRSIASLVKSVTKPPLKIVHFWALRDLSFKDGAKKGAFDVRDAGTGKLVCGFNVGEEIASWIAKFEELGVYSSDHALLERRDSDNLDVGRDSEGSGSARNSKFRDSNLIDELDPALDNSIDMPTLASIPEDLSRIETRRSVGDMGEEDPMLKARTNYRKSIVAEYKDVQKALIGFGFDVGTALDGDDDDDDDESDEEGGERKDKDVSAADQAGQTVDAASADTTPETDKRPEDDPQSEVTAPQVPTPTEPTAPSAEASLLAGLKTGVSTSSLVPDITVESNTLIPTEELESLRAENWLLKDLVQQLELKLEEERKKSAAASAELHDKTLDYEARIKILEGRLAAEVAKNKHATEADKPKQPLGRGHHPPAQPRLGAVNAPATARPHSIARAPGGHAPAQQPNGKAAEPGAAAIAAPTTTTTTHKSAPPAASATKAGATGSAKPGAGAHVSTSAVGAKKLTYAQATQQANKKTPAAQTPSKKATEPAGHHRPPQKGAHAASPAAKPATAPALPVPDAHVEAEKVHAAETHHESAVPLDVHAPASSAALPPVAEEPVAAAAPPDSAPERQHDAEDNGAAEELVPWPGQEEPQFSPRPPIATPERRPLSLNITTPPSPGNRHSYSSGDSRDGTPQDPDKPPQFPSRYGPYKTFRRSFVAQSQSDDEAGSELAETLTKLARRVSQTLKE